MVLCHHETLAVTILRDPFVPQECLQLSKVFVAEDPREFVALIMLEDERVLGKEGVLCHELLVLIVLPIDVNRIDWIGIG